MAKGLERHKERLASLQSFGKDLVRRARSKCELCEQTGVRLEIFEVPPAPATPDMDRCVLLCPDCLEAARAPKSFRSGEHWRFLATAIWSEVPAVQVLAHRLLKRQDCRQTWAAETLEIAMLDEELEAWSSQEA